MSGVEVDIESIPVPGKRRPGGQVKVRPWEVLEVGQSCFISGKSYQWARCALYQFMKRDPLGRSFVARDMQYKGETGVRVWRMADGDRPSNARRGQNGS
jgi:hypothetical protein